MRKNRWNTHHYNGICAKAIRENLCTGCQKLEDEKFIGVMKCKYVDEPVQDKIWIQERIRIWKTN